MSEVVCPSPTCGHAWSPEQLALDNEATCPLCGTAVPVDANSKTLDYQPPVHDAEAETILESPGKRLGAAPTLGSIGPYQIQKELGAGAFGTVYRAFDPRLNRIVAVKVLKEHRSGDGQILERFAREAQAAANLNHPNIVAVYDTGRDGDRHFITVAYVDGQSLDKCLQDLAGQFRRVAEITRDLARALAYAHRQKVIHRDVKPQNVMLNAAGQPLLMDFGLARWKNEIAEGVSAAANAGGGNAELTQANQIMGTPAYMSPEQARGDQSSVGPASDQYSLGVMLYRLLSGRLPFRGSVADVLSQIEKSQIPHLREIDAKIPPDLEAICLRAMSKRPDGRYVDCDALASDLDRWLEGRPVEARPLSRRDRFWLWCRREPVIAGLAAGVLVSITTGAILSGLFAWRAIDRADAAETALANESRAVIKAKTEEKAARAAEATAKAERARADGEAANAQMARVAADERADFAEQLAYVSDMQFVQQSWARGERAEMRVRLERHKPANGSRDRRGFEWYYWERLLQSQPGVAISYPHGTDYNGQPQLVVDGGKGVLTSTYLNSYFGSNAPSSLFVKRIDGEPGQQTFPLLKQVRAHDRPLSGIGISPKGDRLATSDREGEIKLWDVGTLFALKTLPSVGRNSSTVLVFDRSGERLAALNGTPGNLDLAARIYNVRTGEITHELPPRINAPISLPLGGLQFSSQGDQILIWGGRGSSAVLWNLDKQTIDKQFTFDRQSSYMEDCRLSLDDRQLVALGSDGQLVLWDVPTGQRQSVLLGAEKNQVGSRQLRVNRDFTRASIGVEFGLSQLWDLQTGQLLKTRRGCALPPEQVLDNRAVINSPVIRGDEDLWDENFDPTDEQVTFHLASRDKSYPLTLNAVAFNPVTRACAVGGTFGFVALLDPANWSLTGRLSIPEQPANLAVARLHFAAAGDGLAAAVGRGRVAYWDLKSDRGFLMQGNHETFCLDAAPIPQQRMIVSCSEDRDIRLWSLDSRSEVGRLAGHTDYNYERMEHMNRTLPPQSRVPLTLTPSIRRDFDHVYVVHPVQFGMVLGVAAHPNGKQVASVSGDGTLRIWDLAQRQETRKDFDQAGGVRSVAYDAQGKYLAVGADSGAIQIRDASTYQVLHELTGHELAVSDLEFSPDSNRLASVSFDRTVRLWDTQTGQSLLRFDSGMTTVSRNDPFITDLAFGPDGTVLAGVGAGYTSKLKIWQSRGRLAQGKRAEIELGDTATVDALFRRNVMVVGKPRQPARILDPAAALDGHAQKVPVLQKMQAATARAESLPPQVSDQAGQTYVRIPNGAMQVDGNCRIVITQPFYMATTETTVGRFRKFVEATGHVTDAEIHGGDVRIPPGTRRTGKEFNWKSPGFPQGDDHPVAQVSRRDAIAFCDWLTKVDGVRHRLPTEMEWEWACRAGTVTKYHFGDDARELGRSAWYRDNTANGTGTRPVGQLLPNAWGLHDMHGNLLEWVHDRVGPYPLGTAIDWQGSMDQQQNSFVARGGAFDGTAEDCAASSYRPVAGWHGGHEFAVHHFGFRVVRELPQPEGEK